MQAPNVTLALDCSFTGLTLALQAGGHTYAFSTSVPRSSDILPTELQSLLQQAGVTVASLTHIFATTGPGSFTGIRLGLATAQALKLLNPNIEVLGLSTLQTLALQVVADHHPTEPFTLVLDAAGGQLYTQTFAADATPQTPAACTATAPTGLVFAQSSLMLPATTPLTTLQPAALLAAAANPAHHLPPQPVYLKPLTYTKAS